MAILQRLKINSATIPSPIDQVDKEDFAGRNVFFPVALGLCAAVAPACYGLYNPFSKILLKGLSCEMEGVGMLLYIFQKLSLNPITFEEKNMIFFKGQLANCI